MREESDQPSLAESIQDWLAALSPFDVRALVVLGPGSAEGLAGREVWAAHPPNFRSAAEALAASDAYGPSWRASNSPPMAWQQVPEESGGWKGSLANLRVRSLVRSDVPMPFGAGYEFIALVGKDLTRSEVTEIGWALANAWPLMKDAVIASRFCLTKRTQEVLRVLAEGHTAEQAAELLGLKARTVHYHLTTVMERLSAKNRPAAVLRACMLGIL